MPFKIAIVGFGVVGQGFAEILLEKGAELRERYGLQVKVVAVSDLHKGAVYDKRGLDLKMLLGLVQERGSVESYRSGEKGWDAIKTIRDSGADIIAEATFTNLETAEPATTHFLEALNAGKHLITTNKGPVALHYDELVEAARKNKVELRMEGTVLCGTPVLNLAQTGLAGAGIRGFRGILNGTTNFILTEMGKGTAYPDALKTAQELGYAEADPTADVEGLDAAGKVMILCHAVLGTKVPLAHIHREGISGLTLDDVKQAAGENCRWKLIGRARWEGDRIAAGVMPEKVATTDPFHGVNGTVNALTFETELLGEVTISGPGAGRKQTGFALINDLLMVHLKTRKQP